VAGTASGVTRQSLVSRSTTAGDSSPSSIVAGAASTSRDRVANAAASSNTSHSTVTATAATSNGTTSSGNAKAASSASSDPTGPPAVPLPTPL
jgi:hypothetical protein